MLCSQTIRGRAWGSRPGSHQGLPTTRPVRLVTCPCLHASDGTGREERNGGLIRATHSKPTLAVAGWIRASSAGSANHHSPAPTCCRGRERGRSVNRWIVCVLCCVTLSRRGQCSAQARFSFALGLFLALAPRDWQRGQPGIRRRSFVDRTRQLCYCFDWTGSGDPGSNMWRAMEHGKWAG